MNDDDDDDDDDDAKCLSFFLETSGRASDDLEVGTPCSSAAWSSLTLGVPNAEAFCTRASHLHHVMT